MHSVHAIHNIILGGSPNEFSKLATYVPCVSNSIQGLVPRKIVKFNPGLSQVLSKFFLSKEHATRVGKILFSMYSEVQ